MENLSFGTRISKFPASRSIKMCRLDRARVKYTWKVNKIVGKHFCANHHRYNGEPAIRDEDFTISGDQKY